MDWLQLALAQFNIGKPQWYSFKKNYTGDERMSYENLILNDNTATMPTKAEVDAKIAELQQADADKETRKATAKQKLIDLGLTEEEIKALIGV